MTSDFRQLARKRLARQRRLQMLLASGGLGVVTAIVAVASSLLGRQVRGQAGRGGAGSRCGLRSSPRKQRVSAVSTTSPRWRRLRTGRFPMTAMSSWVSRPTIAGGTAPTWRKRPRGCGPWPPSIPDNCPAFKIQNRDRCFARLVDPENLKLVLSAEFSFDVRFPAIFAIFEIINRH